MHITYILLYCDRLYNYCSTLRNEITAKIPSSKTVNKFAQSNGKLKISFNKIKVNLRIIEKDIPKTTTF